MKILVSETNQNECIKNEEEEEGFELESERKFFLIPRTKEADQ